MTHSSDPKNQDEPIEEIIEDITDDAPDFIPDEGAAEDISATEDALRDIADDSPEGRIAELEQEVADLKDRLLRTLAETDNIRKRAEKERIDTVKFAVTGLAKSLLPVADNMGRALSAIPEEAREDNELLKNLYIGVDATRRELLRAFEQSSIFPIEAENQPFDPNLHEVMMEVETADVPAGTVVQVLENGYMIHDRLLRPARVSVSKGGGSAPPPTDHSVDEEI